MSNIGEVHLFVLWERARVAEERIIADLRLKFDVLAVVPLSWPRDMSAADAFKWFYGTFLVDPKGKAARAGGGEFLAVVVRDRAPRYEKVETVRGLERVDVNIFKLKYVYREWVGGKHRVHGTNSTEEARRDIMLLTGHPLSEWIDGSAAGKPMAVLPGHAGWKSLEEMFALLGETIPYAVLRNGDNLPDGFDALHDDIDMLVADASDCARLLGARKIGGALYAVPVAGGEVKVDLRSVGDGYFDEGWQRRMLAARRQNARGVYLLSPEDHFYALVYHAVLQKRFVAADYPAKAALAAKAAGVEGCGFDDWTAALERFMVRQGYRPVRPKDRTVSINETLVRWHELAVEATELFGLEDVGLSDVRECALLRKRTLTEVEFSAKMDGVACRVEYGRVLTGLGDMEYKAKSDFFAEAPELAEEPICWHVGRNGAYQLSRAEKGRSLSSRLMYGPPISESEADRIAAGALAVAEALDKAGIVHRNICPDTLFLPDGGGLKLVGFRFAVRRGQYAKETSYLRKNACELLPALGGDYALSPGRWNDAHSLARCLDRLPQTELVLSAKAELARRAGAPGATLCVNLSVTKRFAMFWTWLRYVCTDLMHPGKRSVEKHRRRRLFARTAAFGR